MKKLLGLLGLIVAIVVAGGISVGITDYDFGELFNEKEPSTPSSSVSGDWYDVYFVPNVDPGEDGVEKLLIDLIDSAKESVCAAVHDINVESITTAFIDASNRGINVQVVMEKDYSDPEEHAHSAAQYSRLDALGLVKTDDRGALMHNKFVVVDDKTVWTGSTNLTDRGVNHNNNNVIVIESTELAQNFTIEFNEMWNGEFGITSPTDTPYPKLSLDGTIVECYFAPEDAVEDKIVEALQQAQNSIYFATFTFTSDPIEEILLSKDQQGVEIGGIYETRQKSAYWSYDALYDTGIPVITDDSGYTMHHKFFIIDEETVITGSFNPTNNANKNNDENILIIHNSDIAEAFYNEYNRMWNEWNED